MAFMVMNLVAIFILSMLVSVTNLQASALEFNSASALNGIGHLGKVQFVEFRSHIIALRGGQGERKTHAKPKSKINQDVRYDVSGSPDKLKANAKSILSKRKPESKKSKEREKTNPDTDSSEIDFSRLTLKACSFPDSCSR